MKACFQIAECSLSYAKIRTFSKRAYTWFSEVFTIIGDLFHSAIFHFHAFLIILLALSGKRKQYDKEGVEMKYGRME